jgi:Ca2+-binding RTX toxin-like protein
MLRARRVSIVATLALLAALGSRASAGAADYSCFGKKATIVGGAGATVIGTPGPDVIVRGAVIEGRGGNDLICGLKGDDRLYGGAGNDRIDGGENQDFIVGGTGDDYLNAELGSNLGAGYADVPGGEIVSYASATGPVTVNLLTGTSSGGGLGHDTLVNFSEIRGSIYGDTLRGGNAWNGNEIAGGPGPDSIYGFDGVSEAGDFLAGGKGHDELRALGGYDGLKGGPGNDLLDGGPEPAGSYDGVVYGDAHDAGKFYPSAPGPVRANLATGSATGDGIDTLIDIERLDGTPYADRLIGDARANVIFGGAGNDFVDGASGNDYLRGDDPLAGADLPEVGADTILGGPGDDDIDAVDEVSGNDTADGRDGTDTCASDPGDVERSCELDPFS